MDWSEDYGFELDDGLFDWDYMPKDDYYYPYDPEEEDDYELEEAA